MALCAAETALALAAVTVLGRGRVRNLHHLHLVMEQLACNHKPDRTGATGQNIVRYPVHLPNYLSQPVDQLPRQDRMETKKYENIFIFYGKLRALERSGRLSRAADAVRMFTYVLVHRWR